MAAAAFAVVEPGPLAIRGSGRARFAVVLVCDDPSAVDVAETRSSQPGADSGSEGHVLVTGAFQSTS
jgi:hypothetical protein